MHRHHHPLFLYLLLAFLVLPLLLTPVSSYRTLSISASGNVTTVTIFNPPINLYDAALSADLFVFLSSLNSSDRTSPPPKVVIFRSADPDIFMTHIDLNTLVLPLTPEKLALSAQITSVLSMVRTFTTTIFIAEVDGLIFGAGDELLVQMDMRFAGPKARVGSYETSIGVTHVGGMQFLARLINKGRALQYLLSGEDVDCKRGKELGWFNDCFRSSKKLKEEVGALATRIALKPAGALNATKAALLNLNPPTSVLDADAAAAGLLVGTAETQELIKKFLVLGKNQTRTSFELGLDASLAELYR